MKTLLLIGLATVCFAATEPKVPRAQILKVEASINDRFRSDFADPYDFLGDARGTYIDGYGTLFTVELGLTNVTPLSPFHQTITDAEKAMVHERKIKKLPVFKQAMRNLMAGAATTLDSVPPGERISMEAIMFSYSFENSRDLPRRVFMSAQKDKLLEAQAKHLDLATVIEEQER